MHGSLKFVPVTVPGSRCRLALNVGLYASQFVPSAGLMGGNILAIYSQYSQPRYHRNVAGLGVHFGYGLEVINEVWQQPVPSICPMFERLPT